jgi:hypothetical protein
MDWLVARSTPGSITDPKSIVAHLRPPYARRSIQHEVDWHIGGGHLDGAHHVFRPLMSM